MVEGLTPRHEAANAHHYASAVHSAASQGCLHISNGMVKPEELMKTFKDADAATDKALLLSLELGYDEAQRVMVVCQHIFSATKRAIHASERRRQLHASLSALHTSMAYLIMADKT